MIKQGPFQQELFDFKYIEDQVSTIKRSIENSEEVKNEKEIKQMLHEQLAILYDINERLIKVAEKTKTKKRWFNF